MQSRADTLREIVEKLDGLDIIIARVDIDAVASSLGLEFIIKSLRPEVPVRIFYGGSKENPQNQFVFNKFGLDRRVRPISELDIERAKKIALVDSSCYQESRLSEKYHLLLRGAIIVIDHHNGEEFKEEAGKFIWVEEAGSASTLMGELIEELKLKIDSDNNCEIGQLACFGVYSDTDALVNADERDHKIYLRYRNLISQEDFYKFANYALPQSYFRDLTYALGKIYREGHILVTNAGSLDSQNGANIALIADLLIRLEGAEIVIVWGLEGERIRISARSDNPGNNLEDFFRDRFGAKAEGFKAKHSQTLSKGGGMMDGLDGFYTPETREETENLISKFINTKISANSKNQ